MKKKLFILSLVFSMCFSMLNIVNVQAKETLKEYHYTNPVYKDVKYNYTNNNIQTYSLDHNDYTSDKEELVKNFKEKLIDRENTIELYYHCHEQITQEFFNDLVDELFQKSIKHTRISNEGDYIRWHCQGWKVNGQISTNSNGGYNLEIIYNMRYLSDKEQEQKVSQEVKDVLKSLDLTHKTDYQKAKLIYDYICSNITYDYDNLNDDTYSLKYTAYAALINKTAVCQGYASLLYRMLLEAGVDARVISGNAGGPHAWNIVKLNGKYYNLDSTWDAGRSNYSYFLKNMDDFSDHVRDDEYRTDNFIKEYPTWKDSYRDIDCDKEGHAYGEPVYIWNTDNTAVTARRVCLNHAEHIEEETTITQKTVIPPTCTTNGSITYTVEFKNSIFKNQTKTEILPASGHTIVVDQGKAATCTEDGITEGSHCSTCQEVIKKQEVISSSGHTIVVDQRKEATCTEDGLTEGSHCSTCNKIMKEQEVIPVLGHDYKDGICTRCHKVISGQWRKSGNKWWYEYEDGTYPINEFVTIDYQLYSFDQSGYMQTGWFKVNNEYYYASSSGAIQAQWVASGSNWYYVDAQGKMVTGRQTINGAQYYFDASGLMQSGWFKINGEYCYASSSGLIQAQWVASGSNWYYVDAQGKMVTGRQIINGAQYYFDGSGLMQTGWFKINGEYYYASSSGSIQAQWVASGNNWYYVDGQGKMVTGYQTIEGKKYYFAESGLMQTGWFKINGEYYYASSSGSIQEQWVKSGSYWYYVDDNGKMVTGDYEIDGEVNHFDNEGIWLG